jgi:hypothetical protein
MSTNRGTVYRQTDRHKRNTKLELGKRAGWEKSVKEARVRIGL